MLTADLEAFFYAWATTALGSTIPVVWAHEDADRPKTAYVELHLSDERPHGGSSMRTTPDPITGAIGLFEMREGTLYMQGHGASSRDILSTLVKSTSRPSVIQVFAEAGIAINRKEGIHDISVTRQSRWEERAACDLFYSFVESDTDVTGIIEKVTGNLKVANMSLFLVSV